MHRNWFCFVQHALPKLILMPATSPEKGSFLRVLSSHLAKSSGGTSS